MLPSLSTAFIITVLCSCAADAGGYRRFVLTDIPCCNDRYLAPSLGHSQSQSAELDLVRALTGGNYSKWVKPTSVDMSPSQLRSPPLIVQLRLYFIHIQELDEAEETLYSTVRFQVNWKDPALSWNPRDFGNLTSVIVPGGLLWLPDLEIVNAVDDMYELLHDASFGYRLFSDGNVWFHPTGKIATHCHFDLTYYPLDFQKCWIIVESVIYQDGELSLVARRNESKPVSLGMYAQNEVWDLVHESVGAVSTVYQSGASTAFGRVVFVLAMKRKPAFFIMTVIVPTCLLAVVTLFTYLVPIHYIDRTVQSVTVLLAVAVFEVSITEHMPKTSSNCMLTIYLTVILVTSALTILASTLCLAIVDPGEFIRAPYGLPDLVNACLGLLKPHRSRKRSNQPPVIGKAQHRQPALTSQFQFNNSNYASVISTDGDLSHKYSYHIRSTPMMSTAIRTAAESYSSNGKRRHSKSHQHNGHQHRELVPRHVNEAERHLSASRVAWYTAYAINWACFSVCLLATVLVPVIALGILPPTTSIDPSPVGQQHQSSKSGAYYDF